MKIKELCERERPRERMIEKGAEALSNCELLAIMLRTGMGGKNVMELAQELLAGVNGKLNTLASLPLERLCETDGIGMSKAVTVAAAFELGRRSESERAYDNPAPVSSPKTVYRLMVPHIRTLDHEECWILLLNKSNRLISKERTSSGGLESTVIDNKVIIRIAIEKKASALILVHNHPSGSCVPSAEDIRLTKSLSNALKTCGLRLLDHVIMSSEGYYSFADEECVISEKF